MSRKKDTATDMFNNKNILITGGTGSFGKKYTEIILSRYQPNKIIIYSRDELKQYEMAQEFDHDCMRYTLSVMCVMVPD